ncbi:hypothetical protein LJK87_09330 [Paenibacillus sp. P25]|nr:hypothetical protein LJK87_09330 [Paenibacillus sp. P25]
MRYGSEEALYGLLTSSPEAWGEVPGLLIRDGQGGVRITGEASLLDPDAASSPYREGLIPVERAAEAGIRLERHRSSGSLRMTPVRAAEEIGWIAARFNGGMIPVWDTDLFEHEAGLEFIELLADRGSLVRLKGNVSAQGLTSSLAARMVAAGFAELTVTVNDPSAPGVLGSDTELQAIRRVAAEGAMRLVFRLLCGPDEASQAGALELRRRSLAHGVAEPGEIRRLMIRPLASRSVMEGPERFYLAGNEDAPAALHADQAYAPHEQAFMNGFMSYMTGLYPHDLLRGSVKHVAGTADAFTEESYQRLKEFMSINSAVILTDPVMKESEAGEGSFVEADSETIVREPNGEFEHQKDLAERAGFYLSHLYRIHGAGRTGDSGFKSMIMPKRDIRHSTFALTAKRSSMGPGRSRTGPVISNWRTNGMSRHCFRM